MAYTNSRNPRRNQPLTDVEVAKALARWANGQLDREIATALGVASKTIARLRKAHNFRSNDPRRAS